MEFSPIIIGTMRLGVWGANFDTKQLEYFIDACLDLGLRDFDHADIYGHYTTEAAFGQVLKRRPDLKQKCQLTTKCGIKLVCKERPETVVKSYDSNPEYILQCVEKSLTALNVDALDLLLIHRPDYLMDMRAIADTFSFLKSKGMVKEVGVSNFKPHQFELLNELHPLVTNQIEASVIHRQPFEDGTIEQCMRHKIAPTAWSPLGGGSLFQPTEDSKIKSIQSIGKTIGEQHGVGFDQILLAWLMKHPSNIIPVIGSSNLERIKLAKEATSISISHQEWYQLWEAAIGEEVA